MLALVGALIILAFGVLVFCWTKGQRKTDALLSDEESMLSKNAHWTLKQEFNAAPWPVDPVGQCRRVLKTHVH
jgi:hypothetical protein